MISTNLRIIAIVGSLGLLLFIIELVRRQRLKEEYSVLWVTTALVLLLLAAWGALLASLTYRIGAISQASTLYFFGLIFALLLLLHFSVRVSQLERRVVSLLQEIALLGESRSSNGSDASTTPDGEQREAEPAAQSSAGDAPPA